MSIADHLLTRCHYCGFASRDAEETFAHLFAHSTGEAALRPADPPSAVGLLPAASPVAAQPSALSRRSGWLRRHLGFIVF